MTKASFSLICLALASCAGTGTKTFIAPEPAERPVVVHVNTTCPETKPAEKKPEPPKPAPVPISAKIQRRTAIHEAGHVVAAVALGRKPTTLVIFTETPAPGLGFSGDDGDMMSLTKAELLDVAVKLLASMAAEEIVGGALTTAHASDNARASQYLTQACVNLGMCGSLFVGDPTAKLKKEVERLLQQSHRRATAIIKANKRTVKALADLVLAQPVVDGKRTLDEAALAKFFAEHRVADPTKKKR